LTVIEQVAERETETVSVACDPALIGEVTLLRRTLAAAVDGSTNAVSTSATRMNRRIVFRLSDREPDVFTVAHA
jgi:hypothetical protein